MIEFAWAAPVLTLLGLAVLQYAMLFFAKNSIDHAAFMAARAGATGNASLASVQSAYVRALVPVYGGGRNAEELAQSHARAAADLAGNLRIELLNPTRESFDDWNDPALQQSVGQGRRVIPNGNLAFKNAADIKGRSGQNIQDANLIKLRITQGYEPKVPLMGRLYAEYLRKMDPHTDAFHTQLVAAGRIPVVTHVTMQMQSDAIESEQAASMPGPGNDSTSSTPGDTPVADRSTGRMRELRMHRGQRAGRSGSRPGRGFGGRATSGGQRPADVRKRCDSESPAHRGGAAAGIRTEPFKTRCGSGS